MAKPQIRESMRMSMEELRALPVVVDLDTAGRAWGLGRTKSQELQRAGEFPCAVFRLGRYYRVRKEELMRSLGLDMDGNPLPAPAAPEVGVA